MKSNCILWALLLYWRRTKKGREGYLMFRRSRFGSFPHTLYAEARPSGQLRIVSYKPLDPKHRLIPPPMFVGSSRWGDLPPKSDLRWPEIDER